MGALTNSQVANLILIERVTACISVVGTVTLLVTFVFLKEFRTLSNTLIFYASFANVFSNVAALIGGSALSDVSGSLCQFQSFLLEMFMQSDPMWSLAMAVNVYLVFFRRFDATRLRRLYWIYAVLCYGIPFIPAMVCLLLKTKKGDIYGNATLWCWIDNDWQPLRIYSYYGPVWVCILIALIIYLRVGIEIFRTRSQLRAIGDRYSNIPEHSSTVPEYSGNLPSLSSSRKEPFTGLRTTEVEVTRDGYDKDDPTRPHPIYSPAGGRVMAINRYSITITSPNRPPPMKLSNLLSRPTNMDKIKWAYTKVAMLFAVSIFITWVPASVNRVYGLRYPDDPSYVLNIGSALVLPLQGFWNTVIYFTTSLSICRGVWARLRGRAHTTDRFRELEISHMRRDKELSGAIELSMNRDRISLADSC